MENFRIAMGLWEKPLWAKMELFPRVTDFQNPFRNITASVLDTASAPRVADLINTKFDPLAGRDFSRAFGAHVALDAVRPPGGFAAVDLGNVAGRITSIFAAQDNVLGKLTGVDKTFWFDRINSVAEAMQQLVEEQRDLDEDSDAFVRKHGWPVPTNLPLSTYRRIMAMAPRGKREVSTFMQRSFRPGTRAYRDAVSVLTDSQHFDSRRPLLRQALKAHKREEWYLAINGLLPLVEGVLVDAVYAGQTPPKSGRPDKAMKQLKKQQRGNVADVVIDGVETMLLAAGANTALFGGFDPTRYGNPGEPRTLNRNAVLHGAARRYGTAQNSLKLVLLLIVMAQVFELYEQRRVSAVKAAST
jgi:hypothetical protein